MGGLLGVLADAAVSAPSPGVIPTGGVNLAQPALFRAAVHGWEV